ncbi:hypothetical protein ACE38W_12925 [Chitinophaga sp. Hz27]|uniref:hypothetical protein n=1 Tax=Chitinophaga sp. Hz27 TaxID=3347169 RepID=UPI0035DECC4A
MKHLWILLLFICWQAAAVKGQSIKTVTNTATGVVNVASTTTKIMKTLTPSLGLSTKQQTSVAKLVTSYLLDRNNIIPMQKSNPSGYNSKFSVLNNGFLGKMKTVLTIRQYAKFLGLKPGPTNTAAVLWILFF